MEWEAELWQLRRGTGSAVEVATFLAGALWHGAWERKEGWRMDSLLGDARHALRTLVRNPGFTAVAVALLALGIGASTALFSVLEQALLAPAAVADADRLVVVDNLAAQAGGAPSPTRWSYPRLAAFREEAAAFDALAGYESRTATLTGFGAAAVVSMEAVTPEYFRILGVDAVRGRSFGPDEADEGAAHEVVLLSHAFWQDRMGASPAAVGSVLELDRTSFVVVGVMPPRFDGLTGTAELWVPMSALRTLEDASALEDPWNQHFNVVGKLAPGASLEVARAEARAFGATIMERFPPPRAASRVTMSADVLPYLDARVNPLAKVSLLALLGAVTILLLATTANLAALLVARGASRETETAVRASLGAGRGRLLRQLVTESLAVALVGGGLGLGLAWAGLGVLGRWLADAVGTGAGRGLEYLDPDRLSLDPTVVAFALLLTTGIGVLVGALPAWQAARTDPGTVLRGTRGARGSGRGFGPLSVRTLLMVVQVGLASVLLTGAALTLRSLARLQAVDLGYDPEGLLTATYTLTPADQDAGVDPVAFHLAFLEKVRALPGVTSATIGEVPLGGPTYRTIIMGAEGRPDLVPEMHTWVRLQPVAGNHLSLIGARMVAGREILDTDADDTERVVVLNETAARDIFPDGGALGRRIQMLPLQGFMEPGARVVGIVQDVAFEAPGSPPERQVFYAMRQDPRLGAGILVRTAGPPERLVPALRSALGELNPNVALTSVAAQDERLAEVTARPRVVSLVLTLFAGVAAFLVAAGLYGVIAFTVARRTRELGVRASLGADRLSLLGLILRYGAGIAATGVLLGALGSYWLTPFLAGLLYGVEPEDPASWLAAAGLLVAVTLAAAWLPARRATRIDPVEALRSE